MYNAENIVNTCLNVMAALNAKNVQYSFDERPVPDILTLHDNKFEPAVGERDIIIKDYSNNGHSRLLVWSDLHCHLRKLHAQSCYVLNMESDDPTLVICICAEPNIPGDDKYFAFIYLKNEEIKKFVTDTAVYCWSVNHPK